MFRKGYVSYGNYGGLCDIGGKAAKKFSLSYKESGERKYLNNVTAWRESLSDEEWDAIDNNAYIGLEYTESEVERNGRTWTNVTARGVWIKADGYTGGSKPPVRQDSLADSDIPF